MMLVTVHYIQQAISYATTHKLTHQCRTGSFHWTDYAQM